jgi:ribose transport system ATP-binding protein
MTSNDETGGAQAPPVILARNFSKTFGRDRVLDGVTLDVRPGEIHGLLGQNGSGKSTLIKILSGFHHPDDGAQLFVRGEEVRLPLRPGQFHDLGLSFVHQDLGLITSLSVAENLLIGDIARSEKQTINWRSERRHAREVFARYGVRLDPRASVASLSGTDRALLAIVRAMEAQRHAQVEEQAATLLVLDEPTAFLPRAGVELLFRLVRGIADRGAGVLFVTHDLDEVLELTDRATVLYNGRVAGTPVTRKTSDDELVELIVGRRLELLDHHETHQLNASAVSVAVRDVAGGALSPTSFDVHEGEIVGLAGLLGSGFEELPYLIFGAAHGSGTVRIDDRELKIAKMDPARAIKMGMALIPGDRAAQGSIAGLTVADNMTMSTLPSHVRHMWLDRSGIVRHTRELGNRFDVRPNQPRMNYGSLSGGNQQKVLLAKWFETKP